MSQEIPIPNPPLGAEEAAAFARLSNKAVTALDEAILSCAAPHWQKVAIMVVLAQTKLGTRYPQFSYVLYAQRIQLLVEQGRLESQGDLSFMRFSEVRLPLKTNGRTPLVQEAIVSGTAATNLTDVERSRLMNESIKTNYLDKNRTAAMLTFVVVLNETPRVIAVISRDRAGGL